MGLRGVLFHRLRDGHFERGEGMINRDHKDTDHTSPGRCEFCGSEQGKLRPVGNYIVELRPIVYRNHKIFACTGCIHKLKLERESNSSEHEKLYEKDSNIHLEKLAEILKRLSERNK